MAFAKTRKILQQGTRAAQPAASAVQEGTLYYVTDELVIERSNLTTWDPWTVGGATGSVDYVVMGNGVQPPTAVDDGAGSFIYVAYTP
jgi:hypothetical protein